MFKRFLLVVAGLTLLASCAQTPQVTDPAQQPSDEGAIPALMSTEGADSVTSLATGKANSVFVAGYTYGYSEQNKFSDYVFLRRYDSDGKFLWGKHVDRCNVQITNPSPSDNLVTCGETGGQIATDGMSNVYLLSQRKKNVYQRFNNARVLPRQV